MQLRALTMNLLVHLVCSYYGTRPRARMHAYIRPDRELHTRGRGARAHRDSIIHYYNSTIR